MVPDARIFKRKFLVHFRIDIKNPVKSRVPGQKYIKYTFFKKMYII